ncbi:MAG: HAD family hydrolase [Cyanobacteria bacterium P01_F01_bin.13]
MQNIQTTPNNTQPKQKDTQKSVSDLLVQLDGAAPQTDVLVDFDETLLLRNSTEEYLNTLQPKAVGVFFLSFLDFLKPWNWLPGQLKGEVSRDWVRVLLATMLFPWTLLLWPWRAKKLAQTQQNQTLVNAFGSNPNLNVLVATDGFRPIVAPILRHIPIAAELHTCRLWLGGFDRIKGKANRLNETLGNKRVADSIVITDSNNDIELLQAASYPYLLQWPDAKYIQAMTATYAPLLYTSKFKHSPTYLLHGILMDQWLILVLACSWISPQPILHGVGLLFLVISFWCIYELGYYENDYVAKHYEKNPKLKETELARPEAPLIQPWVWAALFAAPGLFLLRWATMPELDFTISTELLKDTAWLGLRWAIVLLITRLVYSAFNYIDKRSRVWPYLLLQYSRLPAFAVLTAVSPAGGVLLSAQTLISWIRYLIYRYQGKMHEVPHAILRLVTISFLIAMLAVTNGVSSILTWQMAVILGFCLVRSLSTLPELIRQVKLVTDDDWSDS